MQEIMSFLFGIFTDPLGLPIEPWQEWIILLVIGFIAGRVAFRSVGDLYDSGMINGGAVGSVMHWVIRLGIFVLIWAVTYGVIAIGKFIIAHWGVILCVFGGCLLATTAVGITVIVRSRRIRKESLGSMDSEDADDERKDGD